MKKSDFKYSQPYIMSSEFVINKKFDSGVDKSNMDMDVFIEKYSDYKPDSNLTSAKVGLKVGVGKKDDKKSPFYCRVEMETRFEWTEGIGKEKITNFISQNAPALLLGYIRPIIVYLTANSPYPPLNIPLINFIDKE